ncbi:AMP-binding protein [Paenibacillus daejeonensis]|uniref:AMP-binding protein n=1 Tax=Paenibacillus daejeonensis TaxID=135193 RepID=UPI0003724E23|nr:AMP-binding protein [Paenibacillus daejeonensis]
MIPPSTLHRHLARMAQLHPRYAELLTELGITIHTASFTELPLLTSQRLESIYYGQEARSDAGLTVYRTSGTSTGISRAIYYSPEDEVHYQHAKKISYREWLQATPMQTPISKAFADVGTGHAASTAVDIFSELGLQTESISFAEPIPVHVERLAAYRPDLLYTMPSILEGIAREADDPASLGIRKIILVGEVASPAWQANMAARFGMNTLDILDTYGSIEVGAIAAYSHQHNAYLLSEGLYAESLPSQQLGAEFEPLAADEGVLVLTSLRRTLFPVIRYVTYDVIRDLHTIEVDGKPRQAFRCIASRIGTELKHGEKISLYDIENVVHAFVQDAELRVRVRDNKLAVYIRSSLLRDEHLPAIRHSIEHKIPAIGQMIAGRMLEPIEVIRLANHESWAQGSVKSKKLFS